VRNSSLVKRSCAENVTGLKRSTEAEDAMLFLKAPRGRGALISQRSRLARGGGALSSENAGMSNHKGSENLPHRKSKVSWATVIVPGLVGPKPRRISVGDGQRVNIPVLT
jgi:hypothetical protein